MTTPPRARQRYTYFAVAAVVFAVVVGGTSAGWLVPQIRLISVCAMAVLIVLMGRAVLRGFDAADVAAIALALAVGISTAASIIPRLSLEALYAALAFAAIFVLVRRLGPDGRAATLSALTLVVAVLAPVMFVLWLATWIRWIEFTGLLPSLSIRLPSAPFGHPHDVALLMGLLAPALVAGGLRGRPWAVEVAGWLLLAAVTGVVFMSGGRATWVAAGAATIAVLVVRGGVAAAVRWVHRWWVALAMIALVGTGLLVLTGLGGSVLHRLATIGTIEMRLAIWDGALTAWTAHPITGGGPGTFPFLLQPTGYFDTSSYAPTHADNLYVQALAELGLLGVGALAVLATVVVRSWIRRPPPGPALWALVFTAVVGLGANPAALGYCALLIVVWAGLATPFVPTDASVPARWMAVPLGAAALVGVVAVTATTIAAAASDVARAAVDSSPTTALTNLEWATTLDRTHPLYLREKGSLLLSLGRPEEASKALARAQALNPRDDTTSRAIAITSLAQDRESEALAAARRAVDIQWSEALNHATLAYVAARTGDATTRDNALVTLVTLTPWAAADPAWAHAYPGVAPSDVLERAALQGPLASTPDDVDQHWLTALRGRPSTQEGSAAQRAFALILSCRNDEAKNVLALALPTDGSGWAYWFARVVLARIGGEDFQSAVVPLTMLSAPVRQEGAPLSAPLPDQVAYSRRSLGDLGGPDLPSQDDGIRAWISDPARAISVTRGSACP